MYDPKFEKEVQRKMEGLEFSPSEAVWMNIEREVGRDKKRRRVPFFWLLLAPALLLSGAGIGYFVFRPATPAASGVVSAGSVRGTAGGNTSATIKTPGTTTNSPVVAAPPAVTAPVGMASATNSSVTIAPVAHATAKAPLLGSGDRQRKGMAIVRERSANKADGSPAMAGGSVAPAGGADAQAAGSGGRVGVGELATGAGVLVTGSGAQVDGGSGRLVAGSQFMSARAHGTYVPGLDRPSRPIPKITAAGLAGKKMALVPSTQKNVLAAGRISAPQRPWEAGFTGGIGVSDLKQSLFGGKTNTVYSNPATAALNSFVGNAFSGSPYGVPSKNYVADIQPDLSFSAGILARKPLSGRWAVTVGLNLQYYSARLRIGQQVSGYTPQAASLISSASNAPIQTYPYYSTGNVQVFTNRYYFLGIPASVQWQINHSRAIPLFLEGGASLSYLMSSDALYYNTHSGVYFKDASVINRTQINLSTSLMAGLPLGGVRLQVGPQVQYGLTSLLNTQNAGGQHLLYGGIRIVLIPVKKKS